jgi:hypothetical protein
MKSPSPSQLAIRITSPTVMKYLDNGRETAISDREKKYTA